MRYVNYLTWVDDPDAVAVVLTDHREYVAGLLAAGKLAAGGPFQDLKGALFIYEADSQADAERLAADDPYRISGLVKDYVVRAWHLVYSNTSLLERSAVEDRNVKYANYITYVDDPDAVAAVRPTHRAYMRDLLASGSLGAGGPFEDLKGALFIYEADDPGAAEQLAVADPYTAENLIKDHSIRPWLLVSSNPSLLAQPTE